MMKRLFQIFAAVSALVILHSCAGKGSLVLVQVDPMTKILPEAAAFLPKADTTETARGAHATFQFAFRSPVELTDIDVACTPLVFEGSVANVVRCGLVGLVGIGEPASDPAHDVLRSVSGMFPDPILTDMKGTVPAAQASSAWVTVEVPEDAAPGLYQGFFTFSAKAGGRRILRRLPVLLRVWPVVIEDPSLLTVNWNFDFPECLSHWNGGQGVEPFSDLHWEYLEDMAASLKEAHQNVTMVPLFFGLVKMERGEDGHWNFDFENFNKTARLYEKAGVLERLQLGEIGHRYEPRWESGFGLFVPDGKGGIETRKIDDPSVLEFYREFLPALRENLRENGWEDKAWQKVCDEPVDVNADDYRRVIGFLRSIDPSIRVMEALQTTRLSGVMDVWVPQLDTWHNNYDFFSSRQKAGDEVWFYTCCYPRGEYPNRFIEQPLLKTRMLYWMAFKYGATGYLHWGFNYWAGDPFGTADRPGTGTTLPGGDSWVVYPGYHKFESSLRYEALRDGIEDNTLLAMLRKKDPAAAQGICNRIIFNWWVYSTSPVEFNAARHQLLKALSE